MRCAHCGHQMPFRAWFQFRVDGGYRCVACRRVYFIETHVVRQRMWQLNLLIIVLMMAGLYPFLKLLDGHASAWWLLAYIAAGSFAFMFAFHFGLADAPSVRSLPARDLWRRRCVSSAILSFAASQMGGLLLRPHVANEEIVHYIVIAGGVVGILFLIAGFAKTPNRPLDT